MHKTLKLQAGFGTDPGPRPVNEDSIAGPTGVPAGLLAAKGHLYLLADGMGGHTSGQEASDLAVRTALAEYYRDPALGPAESLAAAVARANEAVDQRAQEPGRQGMGTTVVAAALYGDSLYLANIGDSRAYLIRGRGIRQLTQDHSWVQEQRRAGVLTAEEARNHPYSSVITRYLGQAEARPDFFQETLHGGDVVLLCSDGLWSAVSDEEMRQAAQSLAPQRAAQTLVELAKRRGAGDNISAVVLRIGSNALRLPRGPLLGLASALVGLAILALIVYLAPPGLPVEAAVKPVPVSFAGPLGEPPRGPGYYVSGQVMRVQMPVGEAILTIRNTSESYTVICPLEGITLTASFAPRRGDVVAVFGYRQPDGKCEGLCLQAEFVDVRKVSLVSCEWHNWYSAYRGQEAWVYSANSPNLAIRAPGVPPGVPVLFRGVFQATSRSSPFVPQVLDSQLYKWDAHIGSYVRSETS